MNVKGLFDAYIFNCVIIDRSITFADNRSIAFAVLHKKSSGTASENILDKYDEKSSDNTV